MEKRNFNKGNLIPIKKLVFDIRKGSILRTYYISYSKYKKLVERIKSEKNKVRLNTSNNDLLNYYKKFSNKFFLVNSIKIYFNENRNKFLSQRQINDIKQILPDNINDDLFNFIAKSVNVENKKVLSKNNMLNKLSSNIVSYIITSDSYFLDVNQKLMKDKLITITGGRLECEKFLENLSNIVEITTKPVVKTNNTNKFNRKFYTLNKFNINQNLFDILIIGYDDVFLLEGNYTLSSDNVKKENESKNNTVSIFETKIKLKSLNEKVELENKEDRRLINNVISRNFSFYGIYYGKILNYLNPHETKLKEIFKFLIGNTVNTYDKILISNIPFNINILLKFKDKLPTILDSMFFFLDNNLSSVNNNVLLKENNSYRYSVYLYSTLFNNLNTIYKIDKNFFYNILSFIKDNIFITGSKRDLIYFIYNLFERKIDKNDVKEFIYSSLFNSYLSDINISHTYFQNNVDYFNYLIFVENNEDLFYNFVLSNLFLSNLNLNDLSILLLDLFNKLANENIVSENIDTNILINTNELINILSVSTNRFINKEFVSLVKNVLNVILNYFLSFLNENMLFNILLDFQLERKILPIHFIFLEILYAYFNNRRSGFLFYDKIYKSISSFHFPFLLNLLDSQFYISFNKLLERKFNKNNVKEYVGKIYIPVKSISTKIEFLFIRNMLNKIYGKNTITKRIFPIFVGYIDIQNVQKESINDTIDFIEIDVKENNKVYLISNIVESKGVFVIR